MLVVQTHTHTQQVQCWAKAVTCTTSNNKRHVKYQCVRKLQYYVNSLYRILKMQHYSILIRVFFFLKTVTCYSLIFCSYFVLIKILPKIPYFVLFRVNRLCNLLLATKLQYQKKEIILHPLKTGLRRQKRVLSILPLQMSACVCEELEILLAITWLSAG